MPIKSKQQAKLMYGVASGSIKPKGSLTKKVAKEYIAATPKRKKLPKRVAKKS